MQRPASEILLNASLVSQPMGNESYEFILNDKMMTMECVKISVNEINKITRTFGAAHKLSGMLFELNHVRVDPKLDNTLVIERLIDAFNQIGVDVTNQPHRTSMALCYKPLGEISANVRFYLSQNEKLVFLSSATRPKLVYSKP